MNTIPVLWVSWHDDIIPRGYADQGMLEELFARSLWRPPMAFTFEHHKVRSDFPSLDGAVVCLPARHHTSREDVDRLKDELRRMSWYILILCGDEEWAFPWDEFPDTDTSRTWIMQPRPEHAHLMSIPGGWYPGTRDYLDGDYPDRPLDWFFAGQDTHARRHELVAQLKQLPKGSLLTTKGYLQGRPKEWYFSQMRQAKVIPCPSGPMTVDTARAFEALEAGCVPVVDMVTPRGEDYDYWSILFGPDFPIVRIRDWSTFPAMLPDIKSLWTVTANASFSAWQQYKRKVSHRLDSDIREVRHACEADMADPDYDPLPDDFITVVITTSPTVRHPSTDHIEQVIDSVRAQLPLAEIIVVFDGVRPEDESRRAAYEEYTNRLLWQCNYRWRNVIPLVREEWGHQANSVRDALEMIRTPYMLFLEHDTPLEGDINWIDVINKLRDDALLVRFHFDVAIHPNHQHLFLEPDGGFMKTFVWWQRPAIVHVDFYHDVLRDFFPPSSRTMIEDKMHSVVDCDRVDHGWAGWTNWRFYTYAPETNIKRSGHLDSRGDAPKYSMVYE